MNHIWEGVYTNFSEVPVEGAGHDGRTWSENSLAKAKNMLREAKQSGTIPSVIAYNASPLPLVMALMSNTVDKVKVLDFGGGLGFSYIATAAGVADPQNIEFHVVETRNICRIGAALFEGDPRITFHDVLPSDVQNVSIVHLGSSLHYIDEWQKLISDLIRYKPAYIIFTDLPAGDIQTFVTAQNYYESKIPVWFYNINDILAEMGKHRFRLIFKSRYRGTYFGQIQEVPQDNFPQSMRIGDTCILIFSGLCAEVHD